MEQRSLFGLSEHLERISKIGDPLEHFPIKCIPAD